MGLRIAICQILVIDSDREGNFRRIEYALEQARLDGAAIAAFPESAILGWQNPEAHRLATSIPGPDTDRLGCLARSFGVAISIGLDEKCGDRLYGSAVLIGPRGDIVLRHRKLNVLAYLMDPPYATGTPEEIGVAETEFGRIGTLICADTFEDDYVSRMAALRPDLMLVPYGWAAPAGQWPQHALELQGLVTRRARDFGCCTVGTDLVGAISHGPWTGQTYGGASVAADPNGRVIALLRDRDVEVRTVEVPCVRPGV
jgi:predicted amidohydrolase